MEEIRISPMIRAAIFVTDLERSTAFYGEVLGLTKVFFEGDLSEGNAHELLRVPASTHTRARILMTGDQGVGMVGLFELREPSPPATTKDPATSNLGETCLVFYCADLDLVVARLDAGGHRILSRPTRFRVGEQTKQREMIFRDPDGVMINLIEWDPDEIRTPELDG